MNHTQVHGEGVVDDDVVTELSRLVEEGLLHMGVTEDGDACYWPTPLGCQVLAMEPV